MFLLVASYFFYGWWDWRFLAVMLASTLVDYNLALKIADNPNQRLRQTPLITSLVMNFGFLGFFKYCNFFVDSFTHVIAFIGIHNISPFFLKIILPPGISFYTFQEVAYIVESQGCLVPGHLILTGRRGFVHDRRSGLVRLLRRSAKTDHCRGRIYPC